MTNSVSEHVRDCSSLMDNSIMLETHQATSLEACKWFPHAGHMSTLIAVIKKQP